MTQTRLWWGGLQQMEGRWGKYRETDLICVLNAFQWVVACLLAACNVFMPGRACSAGWGGEHEGVCWVKGWWWHCWW